LTEDPKSIYLTFDEALGLFAHSVGMPGGAPNSSPFVVKVDSREIAIQSAATEINSDNNLVLVHIVLSESITTGQDVKVSYTDPTLNQDDATNPLFSLVEDMAGNDLATFTDIEARATLKTFTSLPPVEGGSGQVLGTAANDDDLNSFEYAPNQLVEIQGKQGSDLMSNTFGSDVTYKWSQGDAGLNNPVDVISQFKVKASPDDTHFDKIDIKDLLEGYTSGVSTLSGWITEIKLEKVGADSTNTTIFKIDVDGLGPKDNLQYIHVQSVDLISGLSDADKATLGSQLAALKTAGILIA